MSSWFNKLSLVSLVALQGYAWGWGTQYTLPNLEVSDTPDSIHFPLNEDQAWFVKPSYLIWRPHQDGISLGYKQTTSEIGPTSNGFDYKYLNVDFGWGSGFRLGIGRYLPNHDQWDVTAYMTYLYNSSSTEFHANPGDFENDLVGDSEIENGWSTTFLSPLGTSVDKSKVSWQLNYFTWDLSVGRHYVLTRALSIHPFIGLRAALINQNYNNRNVDLSQEFGPGTPITTEINYFKAKNDFWGAGAQLGSEFCYRFGHGWSFIGNFAGAFLLSHYEVKQSIKGSDGDIFINVNMKDGNTVLRTNLEGAFGLGWEKWVRNRTVRIAPSFLFEVTEWYSLNQWSTNLNGVENPTGVIITSTERQKQRDLGLLGFTVNLQIDF